MTSSTRLLTRLLSTATRHVRSARRKPPSPPPPSKPPWPTRLLARALNPDLYTFRTVSIFFLQLFFIKHLFFQHVATYCSTVGPSMLPTLTVEGDAVLLLRYYRRGRGIKVGDLVAFRHPLDPETDALKRVVGMPGDFVCTGEKVEGEMGMIQVPQGHCWILGDNLEESRDSRIYGPLPLALINAKGVARVWPLSEMGWLQNTLQPPDEER